MIKSYRYTHANLDNVHLMNGFSIEDDPDLGECVSIGAIVEMNDRLRDIMIVQTRISTGPNCFGCEPKWG